jgi:hypothetical protein
MITLGNDSIKESYWRAWGQPANATICKGFREVFSFYDLDLPVTSF